MEKNEIKIRKLGPIVESIWGILLLASTFALIIFAA